MHLLLDWYTKLWRVETPDLDCVAWIGWRWGSKRGGLRLIQGLSGYCRPGQPDDAIDQMHVPSLMRTSSKIGCSEPSAPTSAHKCMAGAMQRSWTRQDCRGRWRFVELARANWLGPLANARHIRW